MAGKPVEYVAKSFDLIRTEERIQTWMERLWVWTVFCCKH